MHSLVATAKKQDVEPFAFLKDTIARIADDPYHKPNLLQPPHWQLVA